MFHCEHLDEGICKKCLDRAGKALSDAIVRGEPWAICLVKEGLKDIEQNSEIDPKTGELIYDLDKSSAEIIKFEKRK